MITKLLQIEMLTTILTLEYRAIFYFRSLQDHSRITKGLRMPSEINSHKEIQRKPASLGDLFTT